MINSVTQKSLMVFASLFVCISAIANPILHVPSNKVIDWWKVRDQGQIEVYMDSGEGFQNKKLSAKEFSEFDEGSQKGVKAGRHVLAELNGELKTCKVSHLFKNGQTLAFCDFVMETEKGSRLMRSFVEGSSQQFIGEVSVSSKYTTLTDGYGLFKKGTRVIVRASFVNGLSLVQADTLENRLLQGPQKTASSVLVPSEILK